MVSLNGYFVMKVMVSFSESRLHLNIKQQRGYLPACMLSPLCTQCTPSRARSDLTRRSHGSLKVRCELTFDCQVHLGYQEAMQCRDYDF